MGNDSDLVQAVRSHLIWWRSLGLKDLALPAGPSVSTGSPLPVVRQAGIEQFQQVETADKQASLDAVRTELGDCQRCRLHTGRRHIVFGTGDPKAELVFVGEAPGEEEDRQGQPFVGRAGQLLTKMIQAMGLTREKVYIANIIKCRPPQNRNPMPDEIASCEPFLIAQLNTIQPKVICALGTFAAQTLLRTQDKISRLRGRFHHYNGIPLMPTYHPAYLLRNPEDKRLVWEDMQKIMEELNLPGKP